MDGKLMLRGALALAGWGVPVISLRSRSKIPRHANWPKLGMLDFDAIRLEWQLNPGSNVGVLCGREAFGGKGLVVLDVDEPDGRRQLDALQEEHGELPVTSTVDTPSGGVHFYFTGHADSWNPASCLEVRSDGRQCAAPPSMIGNRQYEWWNEWGDPDLYRIAPLPDWVAYKPVGGTRQPARECVAAQDRGSLRDPVLEIPPAEYFQELCGLIPDRDGFVCCPLPGHQEVEPSCKVYPTADRGWFCFGESCRQGGDIVTLAALLAGVDTPVTGYRFIQTLDYLRGRFS